jgi:sugar lactone lactonase YvrE
MAATKQAEEGAPHGQQKQENTPTKRKYGLFVDRASEQQGERPVSRPSWASGLKCDALLVSGCMGSSEAGYHDGPLQEARFGRWASLAVLDQQRVLVCDARNSCVRLVDMASLDVRTVLQLDEPKFVGACSDDGEDDDDEYAYGKRACSMCVDRRRNCAFVASRRTRRVWRMDLSDWSAVVVVGQLISDDATHACDGKLDDAVFVNPCALALDSEGSLLVADWTAIRLVDWKVSRVSTIAGSLSHNGLRDGPARDALFAGVCAIAVEEKTGHVYVVDRANHRVRVFDRQKQRVDTMTTNPAYRLFRFPSSMALGGRWLFVSEAQRILRIELGTAKIDLPPVIGLERQNPVFGAMAVLSNDTLLLFERSQILMLKSNVSFRDGADHDQALVERQ